MPKVNVDLPCWQLTPADSEHSAILLPMGGAFWVAFSYEGGALFYERGSPVLGRQMTPADSEHSAIFYSLFPCWSSWLEAASRACGLTPLPARADTMVVTLCSRLTPSPQSHGCVRHTWDGWRGWANGVEGSNHHGSVRHGQRDSVRERARERETPTASPPSTVRADDAGRLGALCDLPVAAGPNPSPNH